MGSASRRDFIAKVVIAGGLFTAGCAHLITARRVLRIGFLNGAVPSLNDAFVDELRAMGYVPGQNIFIESRFSRRNTSDTAIHAAELAAMDLDLVVAGALPQALAIRQNNPAMPMIIATCPGMVSNGFAKSLKHPGSIYTGIDELPPGVTTKRLQVLKRAAPDVTRVALLSTTPGVGGHEAQLSDAESSATRLGITVKAYRAATFDQLTSALDRIASDGANGLLNFQGGLGLANAQLIVDFAARHRLPAVYQSEFFTDIGGLMAWAPDQVQQYRDAARLVDKVAKGARPGDLPIRFPPRYYLTINKSSAVTLGLDLPSALLAEADHVVS